MPDQQKEQQVRKFRHYKPTKMTKEQAQLLQSRLESGEVTLADLQRSIKEMQNSWEPAQKLAKPEVWAEIQTVTADDLLDQMESMLAS
jgi:hypothetical protein